MSYKSEFAANNTDLQTILDMVNALGGIPVTITGSGVSTSSDDNYAIYSYVVINGKTYTDATSANVKAGDIITLASDCESAMTTSMSVIQIDGTQVASGNLATYEWTVPEGVTDIQIVLYAKSGGTGKGYGTVTVTTTSGDTGSTESTFTPTDSGGTTYKSKFADNNVDLQKMLETVNGLPDAVFALISFTILGTACQAEEGMTWPDWFQSSYFPSGWSVNVTGNDHFSLDNGTTTRRYSLDFSTTIADGVNYDNYVNLISFTIAGTSYQAEEGMTWAEWCESSYNTGNYSVLTLMGVVVIAKGDYVVGTNSAHIEQADYTIVAGTAYVHTLM